MILKKSLNILMILVVMACAGGELLAQKFVIESINSCSRSSFRAIYAVSKSEVWIAGSRGVVLNTSDNGRSYRRMMLPGGCSCDFRDVHVLGKDTVLLLSVGNGEESKIYRSGNRGKTWNIAYTNQEPEGFLNSFDFWDPKNGIAVGDPLDGRMDVLLTSDGGKTWKKAKGPVAIKGEASFAASGTCVKTYGKKHAWLITGGKIPHTRVHRTTNRGRTWSVATTPVLSGKMSAGLFSVIFLNKKRGLVVGGDYIKEGESIRTFASTEDGGKTWRSPGDYNPVFQSATGIVNVDGRRYIITAGPKGIYITDGREVWKKLSDVGYHCLSVVPEQNCVWFAGSKGRIGKLTIQKD